MEFKNWDLFNPSEEHSMLRETVKSFVQSEVEPQAHKFDREEKFNLPLFRKYRYRRPTNTSHALQ